MEQVNASVNTLINDMKLQMQDISLSTSAYHKLIDYINALENIKFELKHV